MNKKYITNEKPYYSKDLAKSLKKYIKREKYGDFAILIEDVFQRRAYEFGFSDHEIEVQAINFVNNVDKIRFVPKEELGDCLGEYLILSKEILLNQDAYTEILNEENIETFGDEIFETLTHEIYHGISNGEDEQGLVYYNSETEDWEGTALDEIFIETAANRATISRTSNDAEKYRSDTIGYGKITFATNLLAASLGTTEKNILKNGIQNRTTFYNFFLSRFPNFEDALYAKSEMFDKFECSLDIIYNLEYSESEEELELCKKLLASSLTSLFESIYDLTSFQITKEEKAATKEYSAKTIYRFAKIEKIMQDILEEFAKEKYFDLEDKETLLVDIEKSRKKLSDIVSQIDIIIRNAYRFENEKEYYEQFELAKNGILFQNKKILEEKYGIKLERRNIKDLQSITEDLTYNEYVLKEDFDVGRYWDNRSVGIIMERILKKHMLEQQYTEESEQNEESLEEEKLLNELEPNDKKGLWDKIKVSINILLIRFISRNFSKIDSFKNRTENNNSKYYNNLEYQRKEFDKKYRVNQSDLLTVKNPVKESKELKSDYEKDNEKI